MQFSSIHCDWVTSPRSSDSPITVGSPEVCQLSPDMHPILLVEVHKATLTMAVEDKEAASLQSRRNLTFNPFQT